LNTVVTLTTQEDYDSEFVTWSGDCSNSDETCAVTMDAARSVTATFDLIPTYTLLVSLAGDGTGKVTSDPTGIDCGDGTSDCEEVYFEGTAVTLTAVPNANSTFDSWGGDCSGTTTSCQVTMTVNRSVTATFAAVVDPGLGKIYLPLVLSE
jgi:hypothetical protein